ncbi:conserved hypothetical protein, partial [Ricinus communis]
RLAGGLDRAVHRFGAGHSGLDHPHHHRRGDRRGHGTPRLGRPLGCRRQRHRRLGDHHPRLGGSGRAVLPADDIVLRRGPEPPRQS